MSEESLSTQATAQPGQETESTSTPSYTQDDVNKAAAAARRDAEKKLAEATERLSALEAKDKERTEAEMTELEKARKRAGELEGKVKELEVHAKWRSEFEEREAEAVEKSMADAGLSDDDQELVRKLPLEDRRSMVNRLSAANSKPHGARPGALGGKVEGVPTQEELDQVKSRFGVQSKRWREMYKRRMDALSGD